MVPKDLNVIRYLGLSLGGAKSERTSLTVVDYYREQGKAFVIDVHDSIGPAEGKGADEVLVALFNRLKPNAKVIAIDAPLTLPPCMRGCHSKCHGYDSCKKSEVRWMKRQYAKAKEQQPKLKHFTPYTQRPVDLYFRYKNLGLDLFQDETLGANLAPQTARMFYLKKFFTDVQLVEVWPKLTLFSVAKDLKISKPEILGYRNLERGAGVRERVLEGLAKHSSLFIYDGDHKKFVTDMGAFDSLLCAWVAMLWDLGKTVKWKSTLPLESGWIELPELT